MKKNKLIFIGIIASAFCLLMAQAYGIPNSMNIQGKLTNTAGAIQTGTFNFTFRVYDDFTGGNLLYETNTTSTTDARGVYDIILKNINLNFTDQMYLAVKVNDDSEMQPRINLTSTPYTFRANVSEDLNKNNVYTVAGLNSTGNLSLKDKIVFGFGQLIDNLVNGWLRVESSLNITGNVSIAQDTFFVDSGAGNVRISGSLDAVSYNIGWTNLSSYPPACGPGTFVTAVGDTITCASPSETSSAAGGWANTSTVTTTDLSVVVDSGTFYVNATTNNVGIGTTNPEVGLHVVSSSSPTFYVDSYGSGNNVKFRTAKGNLSSPSALTTGYALGILDFAGYGATGWTLGKARIAGFAAESWTDSAQGAYLGFETTATGGTSRTEKMRIDGSGNVGIGTTNPDHDLEIGTGTYSEIDAGEASFTTGSSRTFKENIRPVVVEGILEKISNVSVTTYNFRKELCPEGGEKCTDKLGLIAEDFHTVFGRGSDKEINGQEVTMALWLAVQELKGENDVLKEENGAMRSDIEVLKQEVQKLEKTANRGK